MGSYQQLLATFRIKKCSMYLENESNMIATFLIQSLHVIKLNRLT